MAVVFSRDCPEEALVARAGGEQRGMAADRRSDRAWGLVGLRCGREPGWGPLDLGLQG